MAKSRTYVACIATTLVVLVVYGQCNAAQPMSMAHDGLSAADFGRIAAINGVLIVLLQLPMTRWLKRFPQGHILAASSAVIGLGFAAMLFGHSLAVYAFSVTIWTLGEIGNTPTSSSIVARMAPAELRGRYQGLNQLAWSGASVLSPLIGETLFTEFGGTPVWLGCLALAGTAGLLQLRIGARVERGVAAAVLANERRAADLVSA